ncbi:MAG TPA: GntR family transcriptional regulator [Candidatus Methylomirabilis sp.]|nr:GntR family transcriptional regulator [Candidatus Methylomirabilis sp.]
MIEVKTLQEAAFEQLREAIIRGVYPPGQRLKQQELARSLGCSPVPVREALHRLAAEGFVVFDPQRGAHVADFNSRDVEQMYDIRMMLEGYAAQRAAERMTPEVARRIEAILDKMDAPDISPVDWVRLNSEFHDGLYACADHEFLRKLISTLRRSMEPYLRLDVAQVGNYAAGRRDHRQILQACVRRNGKLASRYAIAHLRRTSQGIIKYLRTHWK